MSQSFPAAGAHPAEGEAEVEIMNVQRTTGRSECEEGPSTLIADEAMDSLRFYVAAPSVSAVRRALFRAPGGARVLGRFDRRTIVCTHTMDPHSFSRHWPVLLSRLAKVGLRAVRRPQGE